MCAMDLPGHGVSEGMKGFIHSAQSVVDDGLLAYKAATAAHPGLPAFVLGSSMGGAVALSVATRAGELPGVVPPKGVVLLAPMLAAAASPFIVRVASVLAWTPLARLALISSSATSNEKQYADPAICQAVDADELAYKGNLRVASVAAVLELGRQTESALADVHVPFLCMVAENDQVLGPASRAAAEQLMRDAQTAPDRRALKSFDALHGLLCELPDKRAAIVSEIEAWLHGEVARGAA